MEAILDSSFIISCIRKKIDFFSDLQNMGFKPVVPREVMQELKDLKSKLPYDEKVFVDIALSSIESKKIKKTKLGGNSVDEGLIVKGKQGVYIATLDNAVKRVVPNKIVILSSKNSIGVERT